MGVDPERLRRRLRKTLRGQYRRALGPILRTQRAILQIHQLQLVFEYRRLVAVGAPLPSYREVGFGTYCDADEDGILLYLLAVVGSVRKVLVDLGSASVEASNASNLILHHGYTGLLVDADVAAVEQAREDFKLLGVMPPRMISAWITAENVNDLIRSEEIEGEIDLLSIDIDGNDYWVWRAITAIAPRVVVIEYQDILGPDRAVTIPYDAGFSADRYDVNAGANNYVGASLGAMVKLGQEKGYRLVATNAYGWNAVFVRDELAPDLLPEISVRDGFPSPWNARGVRERWPLVAHMPWQQV